MATSVEFTPMHAGSFFFIAVYSGDGNYTTAQSEPATEVVAVTPPTPPSLSPELPSPPRPNPADARRNAETILSTLGEVIIAGENATVAGEELDYNHDGMVNIADAFDQLRNAGLLWTPQFTFDPDAASNTLMALQSVYGANLESFPSVEGRVWLLYMLGYLPYQ